MNYGDHNFIEITRQTKLRVERVELDFVERVDRLARKSRARRAVLFDNVDTAKTHKLDTSNVKTHGLDTSNVSSRVEPSGIWAYGAHICTGCREIVWTPELRCGQRLVNINIIINNYFYCA